MSDGQITEDVTPSRKTWVSEKQSSEEIEDETRRNLAYGVVGFLFLLYLLLFIAFLFCGLPLDHFTAGVAGLAGPQAIAASVAGFYYAKARKKKISQVVT